MPAEPVRVRSRLEHQLDVLSAVVLLGVLCLLTLAFGGWMSWTWTCALCALTLVVVLRGALGSRRGELDLPPTWVLATLIGVWGWAALQAVALPPLLSGPPSGLPEVLQERLGSAFPHAGWRPLALDLGGCVEALQKGGLYVLGFGLAWSLGRNGYARWFLYALVALGCFEAFYGLLEQVSGNAEVFGYAKPTGAQRASGTYVNSNNFAAFLGMALPAGIGVAVGQRRSQRLEGFWLRLREGLTRPDAPKRAILVASAFLIAIGLVGSMSRGGTLSALLGIAALAGVGAGRSRKRSLLVLGVAAALGLWIALLGAERLQARFASIEEVDVAAPGRLKIVQDTLGIVGDYPLRGIGAGSYDAVFPNYASIDYGGRVDHAHCDVLQLPVELGLPAGLLLLGAVGCCLVVIARGVLRAEGRASADAATLLACCCPLILHSFFDFNLRIPANALWWTVLLGLGLGCVSPARVRTVLLPRARALSNAPLVAAALVGGVVCWSAIQSARADWHARPFVERVPGDLRPPKVQALSYAEANRLWPLSARAYVLLGLCEWEHARREQQALAERAARSALDPKFALESEIEQLAEQVFASRLELPEVQSSLSSALFHIGRGRSLSPASDRFADLQADLRKSAILK